MDKKVGLTEATFKAIYDRLAPRLIAFAKSWSGDKVFSEDIVQDAFLQVWQKRETINDIEKLDPLLYTIVKNNLINHYQKKLKTQNYLAELSNDPKHEEDTQVEKQNLKRLNKHIETLPKKSKEVFLMSQKEGLTYKEIASALSISTKSVEKHISKAKKILREQLKRAYLFFF